MRAFGDELQRCAEISPESVDLMLHRGDGGKSVGEVWLRGGMGKWITEIDLTIGNSGHHIHEQPLAQTCQRVGRKGVEAKAGSSGAVRPDHMARGVNLLGAVREIKAQINGPLRIERRVALNGYA